MDTSKMVFGGIMFIVRCTVDYCIKQLLKGKPM